RVELILADPIRVYVVVDVGSVHGNHFTSSSATLFCAGQLHWRFIICHVRRGDVWSSWLGHMYPSNSLLIHLSTSLDSITHSRPTDSDILGRSAAFSITLFFTAVCGFFASFANSFGMLCFAFFLLDSAVGGSMPTDGTLLLEHMPKEKQYLVPPFLNSCCNPSTGLTGGLGLAAACDVETQSRGWEYLLMTLETTTLSMFLAQIVFFRLHESPRYLVHAGRPQEAVKSLQMNSERNGSDLEIELDDTTVFDARDVDGTASAGIPTDSNTSSEGGKSLRPPLRMQYHATRQAPTNLEGHSFKSPILDSYPPPAKMTLTFSVIVTNPELSISEDKQSTSSRLSSPTSQRLLDPQLCRHSTHYSIGGDLWRVSSRQSMASRRSSVCEYEQKCRLLPRWVRKPLAAWWDRTSMVLEPEWFRTTVLVWAGWFSMSLGESLDVHPMHNADWCL
ncbi:hypothetical protein P691DRAFT_809102, partial [Macrolepiota fuliginosa MF-IS2]